MDPAPVPAALLDDARRAVVLWIGRLGDLLVSTPFLRSLRIRCPRARIALVVGSAGREAAGLIPDADERLVFGPLAAAGIAAGLYARPADLLVDLNSAYSRSSAVLARLARARVKLGFDRPGGRGAFTHVLAAPSATEHMLDRYGRAAGAIGAPYEPVPRVRVLPEDAERARQVLASLGPAFAEPASLKVAVHPGNFKKFDNRWPEEKFAELARRLLDRGGVRLVLLAGPGEEDQVRAVASGLPGVPVLGPLPLGVTAALLASTDLLIANATGTAHLAAAVGTPTFCFLGGYTKAVWMPRSGPHFSVVSSSWDSCRDIPVDAAWSALTEALASLKPRDA